MSLTKLTFNFWYFCVGEAKLLLAQSGLQNLSSPKRHVPFQQSVWLSDMNKHFPPSLGLELIPYKQVYVFNINLPNRISNNSVQSYVNLSTRLRD